MAYGVRKNRKAYGYDYADLAEVLKVAEQMGVEVRGTHEYFEPLHCFIVKTSVREKGTSEWSEWLAPTPAIVMETEANAKRKLNYMQRLGVSLTYARRYSIQCALGLAATDEDGLTEPAQPLKVYASAKQQKQIADMCKSQGITNVLETVSKIIGHELADSRHLTSDEATEVIAWLTKRVPEAVDAAPQAA